MFYTKESCSLKIGPLKEFLTDTGYDSPDLEMTERKKKKKKNVFRRIFVVACDFFQY